MATAVNTSTQSSFGFDPRTIPGCAVWLDAADINTFTPANPTTGTAISQWNDKSGNNRHATQATLSNRPVYSSSDLSIDTTTNPRFFNMTSMPAAPYDIFVVARPTNSTADWRTMFRTSTDNPGLNPVVLLAGSSNLGYYASNAFAQFGSYTWAPSTRNLLFARMNATRTMNASLNGVVALTADTIAPGAASDVILYLGAAVVGGTPSQGWGNINEVIFYTTPLTTAERQQVEGYLASKWGLRTNLPLAHPFKNNPPAMRAFQPVDIDECALWLDAADLSQISPSNITSGTAITQWRDKSTSATSAIPQKGASGVTPVFSNVGGVPSIFINNGGVNTNYNASTYAQLQVQSNIQTSTDYSVFAVINFNTSGAGASLQTIYSNHRGSGESRSPQFGVGSTFEANSSGGFRQFDVAFIGTGIQQTSLISSAASFTQNKNGAPYGEVVAALANRFSTDGGPLPTIGGTFTTTNGADGRFTTGHFHELILYNKALTTSERQDVEGYLAEKWRPPALPTTHPFYLQRALPSTPIFTPTVVSGLQMWLDSVDTSALTLSGSNVTQWTDKSGNNRHGVPPAVSNRPTYNGDGVLFSAGGVQYLPLSNVSGMLTNVAFNIFVVERNEGTYPQASGTGVLLGSETPGDNQALIVGYTTTTQLRFTLWGAANDFDLNDIPASTTPRLWSFNLPQTSNRNMNLFGTLVGTHTNSTKLSGMPNLSVGRAAGANYYRGRIYEILIFRNGMTLSQIQQVEGYLAWKWGLQTRLPTTHPYYKFRP